MKLKVGLTVSAITWPSLAPGSCLRHGNRYRCRSSDASPALIAYLRIFGGPILGMAVLNWMARNAEPCAARNAIVLGNVVRVKARLGSNLDLST